MSDRFFPAWSCFWSCFSSALVGRGQMDGRLRAGQDAPQNHQPPLLSPICTACIRSLVLRRPCKPPVKPASCRLTSAHVAHNLRVETLLDRHAVFSPAARRPGRPRMPARRQARPAPFPRQHSTPKIYTVHHAEPAHTVGPPSPRPKTMAMAVRCCDHAVVLRHGVMLQHTVYLWRVARAHAV